MKTLKAMTGNVDIAVHQSTGSETYIFGLMFTENWEVDDEDQHINRVPGKFQHTLETLFDFPPGKQKHFEVKSTGARRQRRGKSANIPEDVYRNYIGKPTYPNHQATRPLFHRLLDP
jgi:hypothetical protein